MPGLAVTPNPVAPNPSSNVASQGNANGANNASDAANGDNSFSSALQRSMKSNSNGDKPAQQAQNESKANGKADAKDASESSATTASAAAANQTTPPADPLASLLPMLQAKFAQLAQTADQSGEGKDKTKTATDDDSAQSGQDSLLASLAGAMGAQQQFAQANPTADTKGDASGGTKANRKADVATGLAGQPAIIAAEDSLSGHAKKAGDDKTAESGFQALLDSAHTAQQTQHGQDARMARATSVAETRIETPVGHERWSQEVGDKLTWMVNKQESSATLVLNPPNMGRVEVNITMNGDQASAAFASSNPAVREALENAIPRLKEVLADAGVQLGQAQVGADSRGDAQQNPERRDNRGHNKIVTGESVPGLAPSVSSGSWTKQGNGMVDTFV